MAAVLRVVLRQRVAHEQEDVIAALTQRRDIDGDHLQPVVQILAKLAGLDLAQQDLVGRGDKAGVHADGTHRADPAETPRVQQRQDLGLHHRIQLADFVQEDRAAICRLDQPLLPADRASERTTLMAKQLGLEQLGRNRRAIDVDELAPSPVGLRVEHARHQALPRSGLAIDQHGASLAAPNAGDQFTQGDDGGVLPNELRARRFVHHGVREPAPGAGDVPAAGTLRLVICAED